MQNILRQLFCESREQLQNCVLANRVGVSIRQHMLNDQRAVQRNLQVEEVKICCESGGDGVGGCYSTC